jgi:hypothetical protein
MATRFGELGLGQSHVKKGGKRRPPIAPMIGLLVF